MFSVDLNGETLKAEVSFYTSLLYEQEFSSDMLEDFLGVQTFDETVKVGPDGIVKVDFTKSNWTVIMKGIWAALKTANPDTPGFAKWMRSAKGANLWDLKDVIGDEVADCFFRAGAAGEEE